MAETAQSHTSPGWLLEGGGGGGGGEGSGRIDLSLLWRYDHLKVQLCYAFLCDQYLHNKER